jgi:hypothetical protein
VVGVASDPSWHEAAPSPLGHSPVNQALPTDAVSVTDTSGTAPVWACTWMVNPAACPARTLAWARCTLTHSVTGAWSGDADALGEADAGEVGEADAGEVGEADADEVGEADADAAGAGSGWHDELLAARAPATSPQIPQNGGAAIARAASVRPAPRMLIPMARPG